MLSIISRQPQIASTLQIHTRQKNQPVVPVRYSLQEYVHNPLAHRVKPYMKLYSREITQPMAKLESHGQSPLNRDLYIIIMLLVISVSL